VVDGVYGPAGWQGPQEVGPAARFHGHVVLEL